MGYLGRRALPSQGDPGRPALRELRRRGRVGFARPQDSRAKGTAADGQDRRRAESEEVGEKRGHDQPLGDRADQKGAQQDGSSLRRARQYWHTAAFPGNSCG